MVEDNVNVTLNFVLATALKVELTCTSKVKCPAVIVVFAVLAVGPNTTGLEQLVPTGDAPEVAKAKPLSVARRPLATVTADPIWAWYGLDVIVMLVA